MSSGPDTGESRLRPFDFEMPGNGFQGAVKAGLDGGVCLFGIVPGGPMYLPDQAPCETELEQPLALYFVQYILAKVTVDEIRDLLGTGMYKLPEAVDTPRTVVATCCPTISRIAADNKA